MKLRKNQMISPKNFFFPPRKSKFPRELFGKFFGRNPNHRRGGRNREDSRHIAESIRNVADGGVTVNGEKVTDFKAAYTPEDIMKEDFVVRRGKKKYSKIVFE